MSCSALRYRDVIVIHQCQASGTHEGCGISKNARIPSPLNPFQSGLFDQKGRDDSVNDLKYAGNQLRMGGQQDAQRVCEDHE